MCIFLGQTKYGIWGDFPEKFQVLCKNPDEVTRFDSTDKVPKFLTLGYNMLIKGWDLRETALLPRQNLSRHGFDLCSIIWDEKTDGRGERRSKEK
jgi:hypothetical protein